MSYITRAEWNAIEKGLKVYQTTWLKRVGFTVHYSAGPPTQTVRAIQEYHLYNKGWGDIGYNFLVDRDGNIYEGRKYTWLAVGAHSAGENTSHIGVCFIGRNSDVTDDAKRAIRWLYEEANRRKGASLAKRYHSGMPGAATECPGNNLRDWVKGGMKVDGFLTEEDVQRVAHAVLHTPLVVLNKTAENPKGDGARSLAWYLQHLESEQDETQEQHNQSAPAATSTKTAKKTS